MIDVSVDFDVLLNEYELSLASRRDSSPDHNSFRKKGFRGNSARSGVLQHRTHQLAIILRVMSLFNSENFLISPEDVLDAPHFQHFEHLLASCQSLELHIIE